MIRPQGGGKTHLERTLEENRRRPERMPEHAGLATKARRLASEVVAWVQQGANLAGQETVTARLQKCQACDYYRPDGNLGLGECAAPGCGCTRGKLRLASSKCPHPGGARW